MKTYRLVSLLLILLPFSAFSQTDKESRYYYAFDEKVVIREIENQLFVTFDKSSVSDIKNTVKDRYKIEWLENDYTCVIVVDPSQKETAKEDLLSIDGVKSVYPYFETKDNLKLGLTNDIIMRFNEDVPQDQIEELHNKYQVTVKKVTDIYQLVSVSKNSDALDIANSYQLSGLVNYSHPDFISKVEPSSIPADPYFTAQFNLHNTGQILPNGHSGTSGADINAPEAWDMTKGKSSIVIAVIDEGVSSGHPDLPNSRQIRLPGSNFASGDPDDPSPKSNDNHGNACAGIIAASHNTQGVAGIAPYCKIMPIRIPFGNYPSSTYADAITFAASKGADVISNSWGFGTDYPYLYPDIVSAISSATISGRSGKGCVVTFAAGNTADHTTGDDGHIVFPSNVTVEGVLTIGASDRDDKQAQYSPTSNLSSSNNQILDIVAPSHKAYSCQMAGETFEAWTIDIPGSAGYNPWNTNGDCGNIPAFGSLMPTSGTNYESYTGYFGGTSCSAPEVAGVAALMLSVNPTLTQLQVSNTIQQRARKAGGYTYQITSGISNGTWNPQMGHGVLNAYAAISDVCTNVNLTYYVFSEDETIQSCGNVYINNVEVTTNADLEVIAPGTVSIEGPFNVSEGSTFNVLH
jgi:subtilisin family serine protease